MSTAENAGWRRSSIRCVMQGFALHSCTRPSPSRSWAARGKHRSRLRAPTSARARARWKQSNSQSAFAQRIGASFVVVHVGVPDAQQPRPDDNRFDAARRSVEDARRRRTAARRSAGARGHPEQAVDGRSTVRLIEEDLELPEARHLPRLRPRAARRRSARRRRNGVGHVVTTHVHDNHGRDRRSPAAVRRDDRLAGGAHGAAEDRLRRRAHVRARRARIRAPSSKARSARREQPRAADASDPRWRRPSHGAHGSSTMA